MQALRNKSLATRLLLLRELLQREHTKQATLAEALDVTVQAVSDYLGKMTEEGLVRSDADAYRATTRGVQFLHDHVLDLEAWLRDSMRTLRIVQRTVAHAAGAIAEGDAVGLFMEGGRLVARAGAASPSRGVALTAALDGDAVAVGDLDGIVALRPGRLTVVRVPPPGGPSRAAVERVRAAARRDADALVAALDAPAVALARRAGVAVAFEFAAAEAALDAASKGRDVVVFGTEESGAEFAARVEERNARGGERLVLRGAA